MEAATRLRNRFRAGRIKRREARERWAAKILVKLAAFPGKLRLNKNEPLRVVVDNSVLRHGLTHTNTWVSTGTKLWGGVHPIDTGHTARIARSYPPRLAVIYEREVPYFAALASLGKTGHIRYCTSRQLEAERWRQPSYNRFRFGLNVWTSLEFESLPDAPGTRASSYTITRESCSASAQTGRVLAEADEGFLRLARYIDRKHVLDLHHVWTAKHGGCTVFLTTDSRFRRVFANLPTKARECFNPVRVMSPSELGCELGLRRVSHRLLTPLDADWFYVMT
jgi:hypothetical protein